MVCQCFEVLRTHVLALLRCAEEELLAQKRAVSNWADFAAANGIEGWEDQYKRPGATDVCQWTGIGCSLYDQSVTSL